MQKHTVWKQRKTCILTALGMWCATHLVSLHSTDTTNRVCYLQAHAAKSKQDMSAYEPFPEGPRMADVLVVAADKREIGKTYKRDAKAITEALESLSEEDKACMQADLAAGKACKVTLADIDYPINTSMVQIKQERKKLSGRCEPLSSCSRETSAFKQRARSQAKHMSSMMHLAVTSTKVFLQGAHGSRAGMNPFGPQQSFSSKSLESYLLNMMVMAS